VEDEGGSGLGELVSGNLRAWSDILGLGSVRLSVTTTATLG